MPVLAIVNSNSASPNAAFLDILPLASLDVPQWVRLRSVSVKLSQNFGVWVQSSFWGSHRLPQKPCGSEYTMAAANKSS